MEPPRRLTLREAAELLGISKEAVRKRAIRGSLRSERGEDGRVYVYVDTAHGRAPTHEPGALISQMQSEIEYLREENRRKDEIIAQQAITVRQLTAPASPGSAPRESPVSPTPREGPPEGAGEPQTATSRPWWRRIFEG